MCLIIINNNKCKGKGSWICIVPHCEKLVASEALRHGSHSFYAATTPHCYSGRLFNIYSHNEHHTDLVSSHFLSASKLLTRHLQSVCNTSSFSRCPLQLCIGNKHSRRDRPTKRYAMNTFSG